MRTEQGDKPRQPSVQFSSRQQQRSSSAAGPYYYYYCCWYLFIYVILLDSTVLPGAAGCRLRLMLMSMTSSRTGRPAINSGNYSFLLSFSETSPFRPLPSPGTAFSANFSFMSWQRHSRSSITSSWITPTITNLTYARVRTKNYRLLLYIQQTLNKVEN